MSAFVYVVAYLSLVVFVVAVLKRIIHYINTPQHIRWELYPVAHEGKRASYGGGYLEDVNWWQKPRENSKIGELKVMIPEILLLKAVWEHNRSLWYATYPFHLGLYFIIAFMVTVIIGAIGLLTGFDVAAGNTFMALIGALTNFFGPVGFILCLGGSIGLIVKRMSNEGLKNYSTPEHFFNLILFSITMVIAIVTWLFVDQTFILARSFVANMISFNFGTMSSPLFLLQVLLAFLVMAYIPLTHMAHFFMKYFLYHDIRWGDKPNVDPGEIDKKIGVVLNYPVSWSADHIAGHGRTSWAEVATFNPTAKPEEEGKE